MENEFRCLNCRKEVLPNKFMGTEHRNHCPFCLWSRHVDEQKSGDRKSTCKAPMKPIGLTFKQEGFDKYGRKNQGELMLVHQCTKCDRVSINRIAGDDFSFEILAVYQESKGNEELRQKLAGQNINLLGQEDEKEIKKQLFGNIAKVH